MKGNKEGIYAHTNFSYSCFFSELFMKRSGLCSIEYFATSHFRTVSFCFLLDVLSHSKPEGRRKGKEG